MTFFREHIILIPLLSLIITTLLKGLYVGTLKKSILLLLKGQFSKSVSKLLEAGGMPSVHSSFVSSLSTAVALKEGIGSNLFAVTLVISLIIIYDAVNVRWEAGLHAKELNKILNNKGVAKLNETIGHLPQEAFIGTLIGIGIAYILMMY